MTLHELYRQGRVRVGPCLGASTKITITANTYKRQCAAVDAVIRARGTLAIRGAHLVPIGEENSPQFDAYIPTRTVRRWRAEQEVQE